MTESLSGLEQHAKSQLGESDFTPVAEFLAEVVKIDRRAIELRQEIAEVPLGLTGVFARQELSKYEEEYVELHRDLIQARKALESTEPHLFVRVDQGFRGYQNDFHRHRSTIADQLNSTFGELERSRTLLTSKQTESVTRTTVCASTFILIVSTATLIVSLVT